MNKDNKKFVAESIFIKEAIKDNLSLNEFLLLLFFDNSYTQVFDMTLISQLLNMSEDKVLEAYSNLLNKKLIRVKAVKDGSGKIVEQVCLDNYYQNIVVEHKMVEKENVKEDIYSVFEKSFGRTLSEMDYQIINAWIEKGFSEELVKAALNEAVENGAFTLRYIDKVLYEWNRKGYKSVEDIHQVKSESAPLMFEPSILNFNWLDEK
ncbi:MAG: DnaD domain protein [Bacilli bacterium]|nr:DnaD domain protein [Bacilli bacterium]